MTCDIYQYTNYSLTDGIDDGAYFGVVFPSGSSKIGSDISQISFHIYRSGSCTDFTPQLKHYEDTSLIGTYDMDDTWESLPTSAGSSLSAVFPISPSITITALTRLVVVGTSCTMRFSSGNTDLDSNVLWTQSTDSGVSWSDVTSRMMRVCVDGSSAPSATGTRLPPPPLIARF